MQIDLHRPTLWPDGPFHSGTTPQGIAPPDRAAPLGGADMDWVRYSAGGNRRTLTLASGRKETWGIA
jgi:hypothetical protein